MVEKASGQQWDDEAPGSKAVIPLHSCPHRCAPKDIGMKAQPALWEVEPPLQQDVSLESTGAVCVAPRWGGSGCEWSNACSASSAAKLLLSLTHYEHLRLWQVFEELPELVAPLCVAGGWSLWGDRALYRGHRWVNSMKLYNKILKLNVFGGGGGTGNVTWIFCRFENQQCSNLEDHDLNNSDVLMKSTWIWL